MVGKDLSKDGFWVLKEGSVYKVGLSMDGLGEVGEITFVDLPMLGEINEGDPFLHFESSKVAHEICSPLSGKISKVNEKFLDDMERLRSEDLSNNWIAVYESVEEKHVIGMTVHSR